MWSPVGNPGCQNYYPGTAAVDYIGLSIYELPAASAVWYGSPQSFAQLMNMSIPWSRDSISQCSLRSWVTQLRITKPRGSPPCSRTTENYPILKALIWFNAQDAASWGRSSVLPIGESAPGCSKMRPSSLRPWGCTTGVYPRCGGRRYRSCL
jgi:hypothetical protein